MATFALEHVISADNQKKQWILKTGMNCNDYWRRVPGMFHLVIGCTGSVASIKIPELVTNVRREIEKTCKQYENKIVIRIVATKNALKFFDCEKIECPVFEDDDEWTTWKQRGDPIVHIELRKWADILVIAPLDANTLAKISCGQCDNLLTSLVRAWDFKKPIYFCPAMNTHMWENSPTVEQVARLKCLMGFKEIPCIEKDLMCGDKGYGAMASVPMITSIVVSELKKHFAIYTG